MIMLRSDRLKDLDVKVEVSVFEPLESYMWEMLQKIPRTEL